MTPAVNLPLQINKENSGFSLKLTKSLYRDDVIQKALAEDADWVKETSSADGYYTLAFDTEDKEDVLNWANYLIYITKG